MGKLPRGYRRFLLTEGEVWVPFAAQVGKRVRDRIPELFCGTSHAYDVEEFHAAHCNDPGDEVGEYLASGEVLDLVDVLGVVDSLA